MRRDFEPVIKWSGSKRSIAGALARLFPKADRFFDPFVGGGAILPFRPAEQAVVGDIIPELIELWRAIQERPEVVARGYTKRWNRLQSEGHTAFYDIRTRFNEQRDPLDLLFLSRTCVNGLIRFNSSGEFNNSLHHTRPGIHPLRLRDALMRWSERLRGVEFLACDYRETLSGAQKGDVAFLDPPYACNRGRYRKDDFDADAFFRELERLNGVGVHWVLTFDGEAGARVYEGGMPEGLARTRLAAPTGNSPFTRLMGTTIDPVVESVYLNFEPSSETLCKFSEFRRKPREDRTAEKMEQGALFAREKLQG